MSERQEQKALFDWAAWQGNITPELKYLFAIPNGQMRRGQAMEPGTRSGVPDLMLPVPRNGKAGLFIEMKFGTNCLTKEQDDWLAFLHGQGYAIAVAKSSEQAQQVIEDYLDGRAL